MSRRRRDKKQSDSGSASWMTTFSDLMSLLLTFFIVLFSMSSISNEKFMQAAQSLSQSLLNGGDGIMEGVLVPFEETVAPDVTTQPIETIDLAELNPQLVEMYGYVMRFIQNNKLEDQVSITADAKGIYVNINNSVLFGKESASVSREGQQVLKTVAELINQLGNEIIIEGHTDNIPTAYGQYPTNWELSVSRAVSVLRYLTEEEKVSANRLSAVGYGEQRPLVANDTPENRARNRRVNIVVVYGAEESNEE